MAFVINTNLTLPHKKKKKNSYFTKTEILFLSMSYNQFWVAEQVWLNFTFSSQMAHLTIIWGIENIQIEGKENISKVIKLDNMEESWIAFAQKKRGVETDMHRGL